MYDNNNDNSSNIGKQAANRAVEEAMKSIMDGNSQQTTFRPDQQVEDESTNEPIDEFYNLTHDENGRHLTNAELDQLLNPKFNDEDLIKLDYQKKQANLESHSNDWIRPVDLDQNFTIDKIQAQYNTKIDQHEDIEKIVSFHPTDNPNAHFTQYMDTKTIDHIYQINHQPAPSQTAYQVSAKTMQVIHPQSGSLQIQGDLVGYNGQLMVQPETIQPANTFDKNTRDQRLYGWQMYEMLELDREFPKNKKFTEQEKQINLHPDAKANPDLIMSDADFKVDQIRVSPGSKSNTEDFDKLVEMHQISDSEHKISQYMNQATIDKLFQLNNQIPPSKNSYQVSFGTNVPIKLKNINFKGDVVDMGKIAMIDPKSIQSLGNQNQSSQTNHLDHQQNHDQGLDR